MAGYISYIGRQKRVSLQIQRRHRGPAGRGFRPAGRCRKVRPRQTQRRPQGPGTEPPNPRSGKIVAYICHGGWIPVSARIMSGYTCTSTPGIKDDLINAGATVVACNQVSSRKPDDLPALCRAIIALVAKGIWKQDVSTLRGDDQEGSATLVQLRPPALAS